VEFVSPSPEENHIHLKGEEIKWRVKMDPICSSGVTWNFSYTQGSGNPSSGSGEQSGDYRDFVSTVTSEGFLTVKVEVVVGGFTYDTCENERTIKTVVPEVTEVNFQGTACNLKTHVDAYQDNIVSSDTVSEWKRDFGQDAPHTNNNASYKRSWPSDNDATCKIKFQSSDTLSNNTSVQVKADGNPENLYPKGAYFGDWIDEIHMNSGSPLRQSVHQYVNNFDYTWYYRVETLAGPGNWGEWIEMKRNPSHHNISITRDTVSGTLYQWVMMNSCKLASGLTSSATEKQLLDQIYKNLPELRASEDFVITSEDWETANMLKYYGPTWSTEGILDIKAGMCDGWNDFFCDLASAQNISVDRRCYSLQNDAGDSPEIKWYSVLIDNAGLNRSEVGYPTLDFKDVKAGKYPLPLYLGEHNLFDDIIYQDDIRRYKFDSPSDGHCINFYVSGGHNYLYDASFGPYTDAGIVEDVYPSVPLGMKSGAENNTFRSKYFNSAVPRVYGKIWFRYASDTQLDGDIDNDDTAIKVDSTSDADPIGTIRIEDEVIKYTGKTADTFTGCSRGEYGTTATPHTDKCAVKLIKTEAGNTLPNNFCPVTSEIEEAGLNLNWESE